MAEQQHIDANKIIGSGAKGKIVKRDIELSMGVDLSKPVEIASSPVLIEKIEINYDTLPTFTRKKNSGMRTVVAERLTESSRDIPHFYMTVDCQIDTLLAMRKQLNDRKSAFYKISVNDFVIKAVAAAMKLVPEANCMWDGDSVIYFDQVDVSVAVAVDDGLITPVVKNACSNGLATISNKAKELVIGAREGKLKPSDYQGGTFTISNLGMFGIDNFTSIINPPQNGILSVGAGQQKPIVVDGELSIATVMSVTLAMDHRCVDGAIGARFIKAFKETIEDPISIIL
jgi:pyruvate dehydrogenase E2 component (dihydrolipoamide acetyltransferase)